MTIVDSRLAGLVRRHLPAEVAEYYLPLLRPALGLGEHAQGPVVGQLGGLPALPDELEWPMGSGLYCGQPSAFVASIDLGLLPRGVLDIALPESGTLLFFYADGQVGNTEGVIEEPPYGAGNAPVFYLPEGTVVRERACPGEITAYRQEVLRAEPISTDPDFDHPVLQGVPRPPTGVYGHPVHAQHEEYAEARWEERLRFHVQLGGYGFSFHGAPELDFDRLDPQPDAPAADAGTLLAQFYGECLEYGRRSIGDGLLNWMIRPSRLAAADFRATGFAWGNG